VRRLEDLPWSRLHVFPYSERAGTPATRLSGAIPVSVRAERAAILRDLSLRRLREHYASAGARLTQVLLEKPDVRGIAGHTPDYLKVEVAAADRGTSSVRGAIVELRRVALREDRERGDVWLQGGEPTLTASISAKP
jgi:threonylcarbamoyladenosine tRNA methylthiotransferase MtaB